MTARILVAKSHHQAVLTAEFDTDWLKIGRDTYRDDEGHEVRIVTQHEKLRGLSSDTVVYLGYGWFENPWIAHAVRDLEARGLECRHVEDRH